MHKKSAIFWHHSSKALVESGRSHSKIRENIEFVNANELCLRRTTLFHPMMKVLRKAEHKQYIKIAMFG